MLKVSSHDDTYAVHILILSYFSHYPSHAVLVIQYGGPRHVRLITVQRCNGAEQIHQKSDSESVRTKKTEVHQVPGVRVYQSLSLLGTSQHLPASPSISQHLPASPNPAASFPPKGLAWPFGSRGASARRPSRRDCSWSQVSQLHLDFIRIGNAEAARPLLSVRSLLEKCLFSPIYSGISSGVS